MENQLCIAFQLIGCNLEDSLAISSNGLT